MTIAWIYLDKKAGAVNALKDYNDMEFIIRTTPDSITALREKMTGVSMTVSNEGVPTSTSDPHAWENRITSQLDEIDILKERYRQAVEYMEWLQPAWEALTDTERIILKEFYMTGNLRSGASARLEIRLNYGHSQIDRLRSKALSRLSVLLFGK